VTTAAASAAPARADDLPDGLPHYDLAIKLDVAAHLVSVRERVTWTNRCNRPTRKLVFNAHAHYAIPKKDIGLLAKMVEILRMAPSEAMSFDGPACEVKTVSSSASSHAEAEASFQHTAPKMVPDTLSFGYQQDNATALEVVLPVEIEPDQSVTVELAFAIRLPQKKGRWGQWDGITTLAQWLPVVAYYDDNGWQPAPFIPWHQPFFNEAGIYNAQITLPVSQKLACSASIAESKELGNGWQELRTEPICVRDFALIASDRFREHLGEAGKVRVRVLALPEHEFYAREMLKIIAEAMPVYSRWFGPYPYPQFTIAEAYFGWNGNECGGLVMIDQRMFALPHAARAYLDGLVSHEFCHQWWYNVVGTNGYAETWMDEGLATYFSHRLITRKLGNNNEMLSFPGPLKWLPNIHRDDFRNYGMLGVMARGEATPVVQKMEDFKHLVNLSAMTYDKGSKIVGMIEERLGEEPFLDFMRHIYKNYRFRILRVADFQRELELYTGRPWEEFFHNWLYTTNTCDWAMDKVQLTPRRGPLGVLGKHQGDVRAVIHLSQRGQCNEPTVLGIQLAGQEGYQLRIPICPEIPVLDLDDMACTVRTVVNEVDGKKTAQTTVEVLLPSSPTQISVDPDQILVDSKPVNNHWKPMVRWRLTPLYTQVEETDVTEAFDRWNVIVGPWIYGSSYSNPWFTRAPMAGFRVGLYRTQEFFGGAYVAYRSNDRNLVAGVDGVWDHIPLPNTQIGFNVEQSLVTLGPESIPSSRAVLFGRYVLMQTSSLYLPPFEYVEAFANAQNRSLPDPLFTPPGADLFQDQYGLGLHYHKFLQTPYWDAEGGYIMDATYVGGLPVFDARGFQQAFGQFSIVKYMPDPLGVLNTTPLLRWLADTRFAFRIYGAIALPDNGLFYTLGGGNLFRGFDLNQRQGAAVWVGSAEWRVPIIKNVDWDYVDHFAGVRNVYLAPFYDAGNAYYRGHQLGSTAQAVGMGLRVDVALLGLIERMMLRFDVAKAIDVNTPVQFWFGVQHPF
jgi:hypothetical protein